MRTSEKQVKVQSPNEFLTANGTSCKTSSRSTLSQVVAVLLLVWSLINTGLMSSMPTLVIGALHKNPFEELNLNDQQASWFGSILFFAHPIGCLVSGYLQDRFGRKGSMILINSATFVAWSTLYFANSVYLLYLVSVTMGLCIGFCEAPLRSYIGEVSEPDFRGTMSTMASTAIALGGLIIMVGYLVPWRMAVLVCSTVPVIAFVCMTQIPESPLWLVMNGRSKEAQKSLSWLRGWVEPEEVQVEFQQLLNHVKVSTLSIQVDSTERSKYELASSAENGSAPQQCKAENETFLKTLFQELSDKKLLLPLRMVLIVFIFSSAVQLIAMKSFLVNIFNAFGFTIDSELVVILTRFFFLVGTMMNMVFLRRVGKRKLTLFCHAVATLSILLLGTYCSFFTKENRIPGLMWFPIALLISVHFFSGFGASGIPWQLSAEVFPFRGRGTAQGIAAAWCYVLRFVMSITYLDLERLTGLNGAFFFYGTISVLGLFYYWRCLPETEGKTLQQIESYFTKNHDKKEKYSMPKRCEESQVTP